MKNYSDLIIDIYGKENLKNIFTNYGRKTFSSILRKCVKRDCPKSNFTWGGWELVVNSILGKI